ncbi:MAG: response regulator [Candidatus Riflebacteria bacterium]|nr:response regulator [Candidatus Riflebacteria bacterium]
MEFSVLIVEDDAITREALTRELGGIAKTVYCASDGREGLELFRKHLPELVIADMRMPVMDGIAMSRTIKSESPDTPIIMSTAYSESESILEACDIGIDGYVVKPVRAKKLVEIMERLLEPLRLQREADDQRKALFRQAQQLSRSNAELERFTRSASHDLQEPLQAVSLCLQLLKKRNFGGLDGDTSQLLEEAMESCHYMGRFLRALSMYAQVDTNNQPFENLAIGEVIESARARLKGQLCYSDVHIDYPATPVVSGDPRQIIQVFTQLIDNAIKFRSHESPHIVVTASRVDGFWEFIFRDNGIGIEESAFPGLFIPFQRLVPRCRNSGSGLGLALVARILERHGGKIRVESKPGMGSSFIFTLPAA